MRVLNVVNVTGGDGVGDHGQADIGERRCRGPGGGVGIPDLDGCGERRHRGRRGGVGVLDPSLLPTMLGYPTTYSFLVELGGYDHTDIVERRRRGRGVVVGVKDLAVKGERWRRGDGLASQINRSARRWWGIERWHRDRQRW